MESGWKVTVMDLKLYSVVLGRILKYLKCKKKQTNYILTRRPTNFKYE